MTLESFIEEFGERISPEGSRRLKEECKALRALAAAAEEVDATITTLRALGANLGIREEDDTEESFEKLSRAAADYSLRKS